MSNKVSLSGSGYTEVLWARVSTLPLSWNFGSSFLRMRRSKLTFISSCKLGHRARAGGFPFPWPPSHVGLNSPSSLHNRQNGFLWLEGVMWKPRTRFIYRNMKSSLNVTCVIWLPHSHCLWSWYAGPVSHRTCSPATPGRDAVPSECIVPMHIHTFVHT